MNHYRKISATFVLLFLPAVCFAAPSISEGDESLFICLLSLCAITQVVAPIAALVYINGKKRRGGVFAISSIVISFLFAGFAGKVFPFLFISPTVSLILMVLGRLHGHADTE